MAYAITKQNNDIAYNVVELVCDFDTDVANLPTTFYMGSTCFVIESSSTYMLGTDREDNTKKKWYSI